MTIDVEEVTRQRHSPAGRADEIFHRARRHSRRVGLLKIGLPVGAVLLVSLFSAWAWLSSPAGFTADVAGSAMADGKLVMANPKLNGFTDDDLPYAMTAERAVQDLAEPSRISLENIVARLPIETDSWADIEAKTGLFDNENNTLDVTSAMDIKTNTGLTAELKSAFVDMKSGTIKSADPVSVSLNGSTLDAERMSVVDRGRVIVFEDRVRMTVLPNRIRSSKSDE